jgi:hypothetical protein
MIACAARTGSTMLVRTLRTHPALLVHGEVWGARMVGADGPLAGLAPADRDALEVQRFRDPAAAMARFAEAHGAEAVGFKLKYDELVRPEWRQVRALVEADIDLRIVFLDRRDLLRRYLSHQIVLRHTGVTNVPAGGTPPAIQPFAIDIPDLMSRRRGVAPVSSRRHSRGIPRSGSPTKTWRRRRRRSAIGWRRSWMSRLRRCRWRPNGSCANRRRCWC